MREAMKKAAEDVITSEPDLTRWDTVSASRVDVSMVLMGSSSL